MRKGFTMIELIFVIVILGILAAVAIPRLAATRDDAEVAKAATNVSTIISDLGAYYTSQADFAGSIPDMTNVSVSGEGKLGDKDGDTATVSLLSAGKECLSLTLTRATDSQDKKSPAYMTVADGGDTSSICKKVQNDPSVAKMKTSEFFGQTCNKKDGDTCVEWKQDDKATTGIPLVGLSVVR